MVNDDAASHVILISPVSSSRCLKFGGCGGHRCSGCFPSSRASHKQHEIINYLLYETSFCWKHFLVIIFSKLKLFILARTPLLWWKASCWSAACSRLFIGQLLCAPIDYFIEFPKDASKTEDDIWRNSREKTNKRLSYVIIRLSRSNLFWQISWKKISHEDFSLGHARTWQRFKVKNANKWRNNTTPIITPLKFQVMIIFQLTSILKQQNLTENRLKWRGFFRWVHPLAIL